MKRWKIGILGTSDIAFKRFLPALEKSSDFVFAGIASRKVERCAPFIERFGGRAYSGYDALLSDPDIDCVYVPLPPALHAPWGKKVLCSGKHLLMEKPFAVSLMETAELLRLAEERNLAVHENYMFLYHSQLLWIRNRMHSGEMGKVRTMQAAFTFPFRGNRDFRYNLGLGGGALLDCGGYPLSIAIELLGDDCSLEWSHVEMDERFGVDIFGSAVLSNCSGQVMHLFWGTDETYRCELEIWGSQESLTATRIFTAPPEQRPTIILQGKSGIEKIELAEDNQFLNSIQNFARLIENPTFRIEQKERIRKRSEVVSQVWKSGIKRGLVK